MTEKNYHPNFTKYMNEIVFHKNYQGLPYLIKKDGTPSWVATAKSPIGEGRIKWCSQVATKLNITQKAGYFAKVMLEIHPTKKRPCQICGKEMSLYYLYPNANLLKSLEKTFNAIYPLTLEVDKIWDDLLLKGNTHETLVAYFSKQAKRKFQTSMTKSEVIESLEKLSRAGTIKALGPGAMSNFPDRFDGFHSYNRCCRSKEDTGRSAENLKSYGKDRRAYEYWSDGNIHAANKFMCGKYFASTSADHIGPISLGFIHDPRFIQPMSSGANSAKRDRLTENDIAHICDIASKTGIFPMSWYSKLIWEHIVANYVTNTQKIEKEYRDALKLNMAYFMLVLYTILEQACDTGKDFLSKAFLEPQYKHFEYSYQFNQSGEIIKQTPRKRTDRANNEFERYQRIAFQAVLDYNAKDNRKINVELEQAEIKLLDNLCEEITSQQRDVSNLKQSLVELIETIEKRIIEIIK